jgi:transcriptional regulator with XRE-family HTH domain
MLERNVSVAELSKRVDVSYEMARKTAGGTQLPSKRLLKDICSVLGLDFRSVDDMRKSEQIRRKHGTLPAALSNKNPELQPIEEVWSFLGAEEKQQIVDLVRLLAERRLAEKHLRPASLRVRSQSVRSQ